MATRVDFTVSDLTVLSAMYPTGHRYRRPAGDFFTVSHRGTGLPWLILSRQRDGLYVSFDPKDGTRIARRSLVDLVWTQCRRSDQSCGPLTLARQPAKKARFTTRWCPLASPRVVSA